MSNEGKIDAPAPAQEIDKSVADAEIKAMYAESQGSDKGWLGIEGSYFIGGVVAARKQQAAPAPAVPQGWTDADSDSARLALELECLLLDTKDLSVVSKWWASANEALELHRQRLAATPAPAPAQDFDLTYEEIEAIAQKHMTTVGDHWSNEEAIRERHAEDFARAIIAALRAKDRNHEA